jgi:hypothetical protein
MPQPPNSSDSDSLKEKRFWLQVFVTGLRYLPLLIICGVVSWRILWGDFAWMTATKWDFSQILTLLLAFFSIGLSAMFYFRATQTSNDFYNRTYEFTKDFVEKLARIEERFGELLKGIQEDTSRTRDFMQSRGEPKTVVPSGETGATGTVPPVNKEE